MTTKKKTKKTPNRTRTKTTTHLSPEDLRFICTDCSFDTLRKGEYYMLNDPLWESYGCGDGMLCIGCMEKRMGRRLNREDFAPVPINANTPRQSKRLQKRLST